MIEILIQALKKAGEASGIENPKVKLEHPEDISHGDFTTNLALIHAKDLKTSPLKLAEKIVGEFEAKKPKEVASVSIAGPGFINISLVPEYFSQEVVSISKKGKDIGKITHDSGKKIMVEHTDPNPFKIFHIGHLMANTIGESLSRLIEFSGAEVVRACYQGDVGLHVAKTLWAVQKNPEEMTIEYLGKMYVLGSQKYEDDEAARKEIIDVNKKIFNASDSEINDLYKKGRTLSLEYFNTIYAKLGSHFDNFFFESEVAPQGVLIVKKFLEQGVFEKSQGAIIFPGEKHGVHTRVFISSEGLPTYEAKELGLTEEKFKLYPDLKESIVITANEQNDYFKVLLKALSLTSPAEAEKTKHINHGILRPASGKMSSRKGNIVPAESMLEEIEGLVAEKMKDREFDEKDYAEIQKNVAVAALKYSILRQAIGGDIIYDPEKAVSFEGDSGPYLQYACVRAKAVIEKAKTAHISEEVGVLPKQAELLEKLLVRFPEIVLRARLEYSPHYIVTYLVELAGSFNSYYTIHKIIDEKDPLSPYKVLLTKVFAQTLENGLSILGITVPKKM